MARVSEGRRWRGWLGWNSVGWRLEGGGKGGVGGGTNQRPSGKSDPPTPQGVDTVTAPEKTAPSCDFPRSAELPARVRTMWLEAGGWEEALENLGVETCAPGLRECTPGGGCRGGYFRNVNCSAGRWNYAKPEGGNHLKNSPEVWKNCIICPAFSIGHRA